ncbi:MAG: asparagine synthase-related protein [Steroidobacter sp.]
MAMLWDSRDRTQSDAAQLLNGRLRALSPQWQAVLNREGLRVFCADPRPDSLAPHVLPNSSAAVLGVLFERRDDDNDAPSRRLSVSPQQADAIIETRGRWLIENCWGNYVAFVTDPRSTCTCVIKDPAGDLPCFRTSFRQVHVFFSSIRDCMDLGMRFTIDRSFLQSRVLGNHSASVQASLNEVWQIHRGECVEIDPAAPAQITKSFYWNPLSFSAGDDVLEHPERAIRSLRATVRGCTSSWAGCHTSVLHRLSGGLDSSIVAGCLKDAPTNPRIACYTYYNPRGRSDERPWARLAARHVGCEHLEYPISPADIDLRSVLRTPPSVEPASVMGCIQKTTIEKSLAADRGATAVFCGDGGDSGFCSDSAAYAVLEYLRRRGLRPAAFRLAAEVALQTERSAWTVFERSLRRWLLESGTQPRRETLLAGLRLVRPALRETFFADMGRPPHPWFRGIDPAPWSTFMRMGALVCTPEFYNVAIDSDSTCPEIVAPLYSQPAVELFLRIPLYTHFEHGRDRGLARRAFANEAPEPIRNRLWKDRAPGFYDELAQRNRDFLRETFLDGVLVAEGLLDRVALEEAFSASRMTSTTLAAETFRHLDLELWARRWSEDIACRTAA